MNTKEIHEKINKRNKYVITCGTAQNSAYLKYLTSASKYDTLKKGFYTAMELSKLDGDVPDEDLQGYAHTVKCFDKQILNQFKEKNYEIQKILIDEIQNASFKNRITNIETEGLLRNQFHFEFIDNKENFEKAKLLFYKEISLGVKDGLIGDIEEKIYFGSMKQFEKKIEEEIIQHRQNFIKNRQHQDKEKIGFSGIARGGRSGSERGGRNVSARGGRNGSAYGGRIGGYCVRDSRGRRNDGRRYDNRRYDDRGYGYGYERNGYGNVYDKPRPI